MARCVLKHCRYYYSATCKKDKKSVHLFRHSEGVANITRKPEVQSAEPIPETSSQPPERYLPVHTPSSSQSGGVNVVTSKPEVQSVEPIPETSFQPPERYLSVHTPSSSQSGGVNAKRKREVQSAIPKASFQSPNRCLLIDMPSSSKTEDTTYRPPVKRSYLGKVFCRMCLEPITARNQMVPLTVMDINFPTKSESFKQKKEKETYRITDMIQVVIPDFDFDAAFNPIVCQKCVAKLESAYHFIKGCRENEKIIQLYKSDYCPNEELVSCEDVAQNKSLLMEQVSPRKKRKISKKHIGTESEHGCLPEKSGCSLEQSGRQLEQGGNTGLASDISQDEHYEIVYASSSAVQENLPTEISAELCSSIKRETEDYDGYDGDSNFLIKPEEVSDIVKEEIVVKEDISCDFTDTSNNERIAQLAMDYHVKDEDCLQPDAISMSNIDDCHKNSSTYSPTNLNSQTFSRPKT